MHETPKQLTPLIHAKFLEGIREGLPIKIASARAGVNPNTMNSWLQKGQEDSDEWSLLDEQAREGQVVPTSALQRLYEGAMKTAAEFVYDRHVKINNLANADNLSAIVYPLEKLYPELYGKKLMTEHSGSIDRNVNITLDVPDEHKEKVIALMLQRKGHKALGSGE